MKKIQILRKNNIFIHNSIFIRNDEIQNLYTKKPLSKNTIIMEIPDNKIIFFNNLNNKKIIKNFNKLEISRNSLLAISLLIYRNLYPFYFKTLPQNLDSHFLFIDKLSLKNFKLSPILSSEHNLSNYKLYFNNIKNDFEKIFNILINLKPLEKLTLNKKIFWKKFLKMRILINSRNFTIFKNKNKFFGLVPGADLINHNTNNNTKWYYSDIKKSFIVETINDINENENLYDSYGKHHHNYSFILWYGFIEKDSVNNDLPIIWKKKHLFTLESNNNLNDIISLISNKYQLNINESKKKIIKILKNKLKKYKKIKVYGKNKHFINLSKILYKKETNIIKKYLKLL